MNKRRLGKTGIEVSEICFGGGAISGEGKGYGFGAISETESRDLLHASLEAGINFYDTAPIYGLGLSEKRMGMAFKECREKVVLVSKSGVDWHDNGRVNMSNKPEIAQRMLEQSLKRLQTDYIDIYMVHWPDPRVDIRQALVPLIKAQEAGKIRHLGLSNFAPEEIRLAQEVANIAVVQNEFNLFKQEAIIELFPFVREHDLGFMSYGTLAKGVLTGRVVPGRYFDPTDARASAIWWRKSYLQEKIPLIPEVLKKYAALNWSGLELALKFNLQFTALSAAICGARNLSQLQSLVAAAQRPVDETILTTYLSENVFAPA